MTARLVYLDHNATTPLDPRVAQAMGEAWQAGPANPSSQHTFGRQARRRLTQAHDAIVQLLGGRTDGPAPDALIFTSGGTEANNLAVQGLVPHPAGHERPEVIVSAIEHPSVRGPAALLAQRGFVVHQVRPDADGVIPPQAVARLLSPRTSLVSVMLANNETGVLQPVHEIAQLCHALEGPTRVLVHTDASQAVGKHPVHFAELGVDALTISPHKFGGPVGIGGLLLRHGVLPRPLLAGGFQQHGLRPGTESVPLAVGFQEALRLAQHELPSRIERLRQLRDRLEAGLLAAGTECHLFGRAARRLPNTSCVAFPGVNRQALVMALDLEGLACSTGSACASGSSEPSPALLAMGADPALVEGAIRLSLGPTNTLEEVDWAVDRISFHVKKLRIRAP